MCAQTQDIQSACALLEAGADFCASSNAVFTEALFRLCKGVVSLISCGWEEFLWIRSILVDRTGSATSGRAERDPGEGAGVDQRRSRIADEARRVEVVLLGSSSLLLPVDWRG